MKRLVFAIPGELETATGGYIYDRRVIEGLRGKGWEVQVLALGDRFPYPDVPTRQKACERLLNLEAGVPLVIDGLAFGVLPEVAPELTQRHPLIALVHHPLAFETGLSVQQAAHFEQTEKRALAHADHIVVTSPATLKDLVERFAVPRNAITSVLPGTDRIARVSNTTTRDSLHLLSVGSVVKRKGFDVLLAALAPLTQMSWQLTIAGDLSRDAQAVAQLHLDVQRFGLAKRVHILGAVDSARLQALYSDADVFVLASRFEGYGMAYAEALANGLPVIGTSAGAIPDTVPSAAGLLAEPGDIDSLTHALRQIMQEPDLRQRLAQGALAAAALQPSWADCAASFEQVVARTCALKQF